MQIPTQGAACCGPLATARSKAVAGSSAALGLRVSKNHVVRLLMSRDVALSLHQPEGKQGEAGKENNWQEPRLLPAALQAFFSLSQTIR